VLLVDISAVPLHVRSASRSIVLLVLVGVSPASAYGMHPFIDLRQLEFPKPSHSVSWQALGLDPTVYGILSDAEVSRVFVDSNPKFRYRSSHCRALEYSSARLASGQRLARLSPSKEGLKNKRGPMKIGENQRHPLVILMRLGSKEHRTGGSEFPPKRTSGKPSHPGCASTAVPEAMIHRI
jgi:hypothetical protein